MNDTTDPAAEIRAVDLRMRGFSYDESYGYWTCPVLCGQLYRDGHGRGYWWTCDGKQLALLVRLDALTAILRAQEATT